MKRRAPLLLAGLALAALGGCASAPEERFYTLSAVAEPATATRAYTVSVGPVNVPEMVDRPQLVLRLAANRVEILEQARWATPLPSGIGQVVAANLARLLGGTRVAAYPQSAVSDPDYRVAVDVQRFESAPGTAASLDALWTIRSARGALVKAGRSTIDEPARGGDTEALVAAHDRALAALSRDIARALPAMASP
ncbi:PqiC family protein [Azotobacter salinestris]|uniref:PqiC family protein n=1 Tax=Azotobacter salinestris TaxID=69964 RepID=UPI00126691F5|nr:PqiC family protein [Azotobacter salinestris]